MNAQVASAFATIPGEVESSGDARVRRDGLDDKFGGPKILPCSTCSTACRYECRPATGYASTVLSSLRSVESMGKGGMRLRQVWTYGC